MTIIREEGFYTKPDYIEEFSMCGVHANHTDGSKGTCVLINNSDPRYIRLGRLIGNAYLPCGIGLKRASSYWIGLSSEERDEKCPKIAWGISAYFLWLIMGNSSDKAMAPDDTISYSDYYKEEYDLYCSRNRNSEDLPPSNEEELFLAEHIQNERANLSRTHKALETYKIGANMYLRLEQFERGYLDWCLKKQKLQNKQPPIHATKPNKKTFVDCILEDDKEKALEEYKKNFIDFKGDDAVREVLIPAIKEKRLKKPSYSVFNDSFPGIICRSEYYRVIKETTETKKHEKFK